jgi:hypothetical protein
MQRENGREIIELNHEALLCRAQSNEVSFKIPRARATTRSVINTICFAVAPLQIASWTSSRELLFLVVVLQSLSFHVLSDVESSFISCLPANAKI